MSIFFEIADISYELKGISMELVAEDCVPYFKEKRTRGYEPVLCYVDFVEEYEPLQGSLVMQDPYRLIMKQNECEVRIFFRNPYSDIYGIYYEMIDSDYIGHEIRVETTQKKIDRLFLELLCFEKFLLLRDAFILHSCYIEYREGGIAFTAPSGTGKSTQGALWEQFAGAKMINGDRSIIQRKDKKWFIHGLPFSGSSFMNVNQSMPLKAIAIVNQHPSDYVESADYNKQTHMENQLKSDIDEIDMDAIRDLNKVMNEVTVNKWDSSAVNKVLALVEDLFEQDIICNLYCTPTSKACYALKEYLYHD